jgi:hypothetical protein
MMSHLNLADMQAVAALYSKNRGGKRVVGEF